MRGPVRPRGSWGCTLTCTGVPALGGCGPRAPSRSPGSRGGHLHRDSSSREGQGSALALSSPMRQRHGADTGSPANSADARPSPSARWTFVCGLFHFFQPSSQTWHQSLAGGPVLPLRLFFPSLKCGSHTILLSVPGVQHSNPAFILETDYITY